ncbi:hypothetical protein HHE03_18590 [Helicobacter heilmannii]|nr:hypothetical protein HHE03_18590 [Helicobacter heilmannii]
MFFVWGCPFCLNCASMVLKSMGHKNPPPLALGLSVWDCHA